MHQAAAQTLALAVGVGALVSLLCARLRIPAVLPLLLVGFAMGVSGLGLVDARDLESGLRAIVSVSIGLLIFEGGLHLSARELGKAPRAIPRLLTIGALLTGVGVACAARFAVGLPWSIAAVLGAALIVTGPTVVQPILRRVRLTPSLHAALSAEAILIDPIGVVATVMALEVVLLVIGEHSATAAQLSLQAARTVLGGLGMGLAVGLAARGAVWALTRRAPLTASGLNQLAIAACMISVGMGEWVAPEGGLVAATLCAVLLANLRTVTVKDVHEFHEQVSGLLVGTLFVIIASRVDLAALGRLTWRDGVFVGAIVLLVRPACVFVSTLGTTLSVRERMFAAFMAPRGIVAASVASIAATQLKFASPELAAEAAKFETLVLLVIVVTVAMTGTLAGPVARLLRVEAGQPGNVLIVGAHRLGVAFGLALRDAGISVLMVDSNDDRAAAAEALGLRVARGDATDPSWLEEQTVPLEVGWVVAWTGNPVVDRVVARWGLSRFGAGRAAAWTPRGLSSSVSAGEKSGLKMLLELVDRVQGGRVEVRRWTGVPENRVLLAEMKSGKLITLAPAATGDGSRELIGVVDVPTGSAARGAAPAA
jgi:NhaP-type Na+/H+ or K+/H+ antiporter